MAKTKAQLLKQTEEDYTEIEDSSTEDDQTDPTFDILEETRSSLSRLSLKKSNSRVAKVKESDKKRKLDFDSEEVEIPVFDEADQKSFEIVEKIIQVGLLEKLKVDQCKVYLRKYGLRLTGKKDILMERIREHLGIINGGGEQKYPASSFVMNCKGDACTGDVVMFEQNVYEMYNIASRSASGPPCGTRVVAGRIVKESYGAAKQQHTFTIEVLWSKGEKPLPPLHPLLIKGRNLYRLQTMRQKWDDEAERSRVLLEKHSRGSLARSSRDSRIQEKESRKMLREQRAMRNMSSTNNKENQQQSLSNPAKRNYSQQPPILTHRPQNPIVPPIPNAVKPSHSQPQVVLTQRPQNPVPPSIQPNRILTEINHRSNLNPQQSLIKPQMNSIPQQSSRPWWGNATHDPPQYQIKPVINSSLPSSPLRGSMISLHKSPSRGPIPRQVCNYYLQRRCNYGDSCKFLHDDSRRDQSFNSPPRSPMRHYQGNDNVRIRNHPNVYVNNRPASPMRREPCKHFAFNRCYYGDNCKFSHAQQNERRW
ncbi:hypothetical protein ACHQM5_001597 [Ranunculus cassubicifolius]